ncbi:GDSL-type esterase/lipase family protein [Paenibacillus cymbidii]|uniref:GDSL-type esterase/lipase family protein n=1 Tax=Paenibacillus cymbidii TaxID=1639034 RepID=UPI0010820FB4|nr:GDSL-type esterase/lipase family protein [Paenibacillus cymbidii]
MIDRQVELHNVAELAEVPGREGKLLQRVPETVRQHIREGAATVYRSAAGCEIRFVSDWNPVKLTLACHSGETKAYLYYGDFQGPSFTIKPEPTTIELTPPAADFLRRADFDGSAYPHHPRVWRLLFQGGEIHLLDIEGASLRPPAADELPKLRYLAYGTSITQGAAATHPNLSYVKQTAWRLGADAINLGASGNAYCEPAIADYIAARDDWDIATACISVNMLNQGVTAAEFADKARYFVRTIAGNTNRPVACIGLFPFFGDLGYVWPDRHPQATPDEYRAALRSIAEDPSLPNVSYIDGRELMTSLRGHASDLLHPGDNAMIEIAEHLAPRLKALLKRN